MRTFGGRGRSPLCTAPTVCTLLAAAILWPRFSDRDSSVRHDDEGDISH